MALSNLDNDNITRLFTMLSLNEDNKIEIIKKKLFIIRSTKINCRTN